MTPLEIQSSLHWLASESETECEACLHTGKTKEDDNSGLIFHKVCNECDGTGLKLTSIGKTVLNFYQFIQRLDARIKFRRSMK